MLSQPEITSDFGKFWKNKETNTYDCDRGLRHHPDCSESKVLLNSGSLKKSRSKNIFSSEKNDFENFDFQKKSQNPKFWLRKSIFPSKIL